MIDINNYKEQIKLVSYLHAYNDVLGMIDNSFHEVRQPTVKGIRRLVEYKKIATDKELEKLKENIRENMENGS